MSSLREDIMRVPGVRSVEIDGTDDAPTGVRVTLGSDVDPASARSRIVAVLEARGISTAGSGGPPTITPERTASPGSRSVEVAAAEQADDREASPDLPVAEGSPVRDAQRSAAEAYRENGRDPLASVAIVEASDGVAVEVRTVAGRSRSARALPGDLDGAVARAVAGAVDDAAPVPVVVAVEDRLVGDTPVITVVLDTERGRVAGSAVVGSGRAYALGLAVWAALVPGSPDRGGRPPG